MLWSGERKWLSAIVLDVCCLAIVSQEMNDVERIIEMRIECTQQSSISPLRHAAILMQDVKISK